MNHGILVGAGFLLGTLGVKALKSEPVRKAAVATVAQGLKVKEEAESIVDEAKAELDDILAEAGYDKGAEETEEEAAKELAEAQEAEASNSHAFRDQTRDPRKDPIRSSGENP